MFLIDPMSRTPIYEQLTSQIEKRILVGVLPSGTQLPSVRALSCELSINPNTVQKAYTDLCQKDVLCSVPGKGCFVAPNAADILRSHSRKHLCAFADQIRELRLAGIPKQELLDILNEQYSEGSDRDVASSASDQTL